MTKHHKNREIQSQSILKTILFKIIYLATIVALSLMVIVAFYFGLYYLIYLLS